MKNLSENRKSCIFARLKRIEMATLIDAFDVDTCPPLQMVPNRVSELERAIPMSELLVLVKEDIHAMYEKAKQ